MNPEHFYFTLIISTSVVAYYIHISWHTVENIAASYLCFNIVDKGGRVGYTKNAILHPAKKSFRKFLIAFFQRSKYIKRQIAYSKKKVFRHASCFDSKRFEHFTFFFLFLFLIALVFFFR